MSRIRHALTAATVAGVLLGISGTAAAAPFSCDSDISKKTVINLLAKHYGQKAVYTFNPVERQWAPYLEREVDKGHNVESSIFYYYNAHLALEREKLSARLYPIGGTKYGVEVYLCPYKIRGSLSEARVEDIMKVTRSTSDGDQNRPARASAPGANVFMVFLRPKSNAERTKYQLTVR
ncbi:MAG: hypothetical protein R3B13_33840 [Polyangiaceae bacterium]